MSNLENKRIRPSFEERWRKRFIEFSKNEDDAGIAGWSITGLEARYRHFARIWTGDSVGSLWLDVGCGAGTYSRFLAVRNISVIGVDYSLPTVIKARERSGADGFWAVADVKNLPVAESAFSGVMCFGVMQALADTTPAVHELVRAVKPGGQVWIDALNRWCVPTVWERFIRRMRKRPEHLRYDSVRKLRRIMLEQGCTHVRYYWVPILPQPLQRYQWVMEAPGMRWLLHTVPLIGALISHAFVLQGERAPSSR